MLTGRQEEWHEYTVVGQIKKFRDQNLEEKDGGWYIVPGKVDSVAWLLPVFFVFTIGFLMYFAGLG